MAIFLHMAGEAGGGAPAPVTTPEPAAPAAPAADPAKPAAGASDDPWKLYDGVDGDQAYSKALERRRGWSPEDRAAADALARSIVQSRLKRVEGRKYGDKDVEARIAEAKAAWEKEAAAKAPTQPEYDAEEQAYLETIHPSQRENVAKLLAITKKREAALRTELDGIRKPINDAQAQAQAQAKDAEYKAMAEQILEKVPTVDPFTVVDILKKNDAAPEGDRMTVEEMVMLAQQLEDDRFNHVLPARLSAKDEKTISLLKTTFLDGVKAGEPWAAEVLNDLLASYEEAKRSMPIERPGQAAGKALGGPVKWNAGDAARGI